MSKLRHVLSEPFEVPSASSYCGPLRIMAMVLEPWVFGLWGLGVYALRIVVVMAIAVLGSGPWEYRLRASGGWTLAGAGRILLYLT